jgi:hypothetical protein
VLGPGSRVEGGTDQPRFGSLWEPAPVKTPALTRVPVVRPPDPRMEINPYAPPAEPEGGAAAPPAGARPSYTLYSPNQVLLAGFLGSPIAAAILVFLDYRRQGRARDATRVLVLGVVGTAAMIGLAVVLPDGIGNFLPIVGIAVGFAILGQEPSAIQKPKWAAGQTVDVEITLVKNDKQDLACSSPDEIGGKHCAFEANSKPWSKGDNNDDKKVLRPYTTTEHLQFTAAGVWSDPALAPDKLPATRFSLKCKYKVEGTLKSLGVRWEQTGQWFPNNEWYAGSVSDCKLTP